MSSPIEQRSDAPPYRNPVTARGKEGDSLSLFFGRRVLPGDLSGKPDTERARSALPPTLPPTGGLQAVGAWPTLRAALKP
jgi:hypothetical protein